MRRLAPLAGAALRSCSTHWPHRSQSSSAQPPHPAGDAATAPTSAAAMIESRVAGAERVTHAQVWALWNEGNLFSLSLTQMQDFLQSVGVATDSGLKKAAAVRRIEAYLHAHDAGAQGLSGQSPANATAPHLKQQQQQQQQPNAAGYGRYTAQTSTLPPETLLDLAQAGFYGGVANMAPRAFQLLCDGASPDAVITRIHTAAFPGFPANTECYSLVPSDAHVALRARLSKVMQWCYLNMSNLHMDGELHVSVGKLLVEPVVAKSGTPNSVAAGEVVLSAYTLQQRLQLDRPYTWVSTVPESAVGAVEAFLRTEGFAPVAATPQLGYDATIKRLQDTLHAELDAQGRLVTLHSEWVSLQTAYHTRDAGPDVRLLLRSRPPVRQVDVDTYSASPIVELANDDVQDVLPPASGQLVYLSENESRRFERVSSGSGVVVTVTEVRRQPLIVLRDEEEDLRVEYSVTVAIPANSGGGPALDVRAVGLEVFELANRLAAAVTGPFEEAYGGS